MFDIVARNFCDLVHHLIHSRYEILQEIHLFADYFVRDYFVHDSPRERQNAPQAVQKAQQCLIVLILYLQELNGRALPLLLIRQ